MKKNPSLPIFYGLILLMFLTAVFPSLLLAETEKLFSCKVNLEEGVPRQKDNSLTYLSTSELTHQGHLNSCKLLNEDEIRNLKKLEKKLEFKISSNVPDPDFTENFDTHLERKDLFEYEQEVLNKAGIQITEIPFFETGSIAGLSIFETVMNHLVKHYLYFKLIINGKVLDDQTISKESLDTAPIVIQDKLKIKMIVRGNELRDGLLYLKVKYPTYFNNAFKAIFLTYGLRYNFSNLNVEPFDIKNPEILQLNDLGCVARGCYFKEYDSIMIKDLIDCKSSLGIATYKEVEKQWIYDIFDYLKEDGIYSFDPRNFCENKTKPIPEEKLNCYQTGVNFVLAKNSNTFIPGNHSVSTDGYGTCQFITALWNTKGTGQNSHIDFIFGRFFNQAKQTENLKCEVITKIKTNLDGSMDKNLQVTDCQNLTDGELLKLSKDILRGDTKY